MDRRVDDAELVAVFTQRQTKTKCERRCGCGHVIPAHTKNGLEKLYQHHLTTDARHSEMQAPGVG